MSRKEPISIAQYIDARGVHTVSALCRVTPQTVYNWRAKTNAPKPLYAHLMIEDSMHMLSYDSIYSEYIMQNFQQVSEHRALPFSTDPATYTSAV